MPELILRETRTFILHFGRISYVHYIRVGFTIILKTWEKFLLPRRMRALVPHLNTQYEPLPEGIRKALEQDLFKHWETLHGICC